jgi:hypothetical protein
METQPGSPHHPPHLVRAKGSGLVVHRSARKLVSALAPLEDAGLPEATASRKAAVVCGLPSLLHNWTQVIQPRPPTQPNLSYSTMTKWTVVTGQVEKEALQKHSCVQDLP